MGSDMPSVNKVIIIGNLTRDPQSKQLPSQTTVTEFGIAMNRKFKGAGGEEREEVCFVDCAAFGRSAEVIQKYCTKGKTLYVEGRLKLDSWDDKQGGGKRSKLSVVVENFQFLGPAGTPEGGDSRGQQPRQGTGRWDGPKLPPRAAVPQPQQPFGDDMEFKEADIPF
jgi:single-strand DNA-binding protein